MAPLHEQCPPQPSFYHQNDSATAPPPVPQDGKTLHDTTPFRITHTFPAFTTNSRRPSTSLRTPSPAISLCSPTSKAQTIAYDATYTSSLSSSPSSRPSAVSAPTYTPNSSAPTKSSLSSSSSPTRSSFYSNCRLRFLIRTSSACCTAWPLCQTCGYMRASTSSVSTPTRHPDRRAGRLLADTDTPLPAGPVLHARAMPA